MSLVDRGVELRVYPVGVDDLGILGEGGELHADVVTVGARCCRGVVVYVQPVWPAADLGGVAVAGNVALAIRFGNAPRLQGVATIALAAVFDSEKGIALAEGTALLDRHAGGRVVYIVCGVECTAVSSFTIATERGIYGGSSCGRW